MCTQGPGAHFRVQVQGRGYRHRSRILTWVLKKKGSLFVPFVTVTRAPYQGIKYERCL